MSILRADSIRDRAGTGAPDFPNGLTGNLTGTATTATTLSGTPNISVGTLGCGNVTSTGDVTGVNATFSGNLTVQGTTTTIDTAVTSVDSLAVDGSVGIGTTNPDRLLHLSSNTNTRAKIATTNESSFGLLYLGDEEKFILGYRGSHPNEPHGISIKATNADGHINLRTGGDNERLRITSGGAAIFKAGLAEKYENAGTTLGAQTNNPLSNGNVILFTGNESGNNTINFTGVHATLSNGETVSFTAIITPNNSGVINAVQIDGQSPAGGLKWSGGSAPSAGSSGQDIYTFQILKTGTGATDYTVFGAATNYA